MVADAAPTPPTHGASTVSETQTEAEPEAMDPKMVSNANPPPPQTNSSSADCERTVFAAQSDSFRVGPSTVPNAGRGLFAAREFKRDEVVVKYEGGAVESTGEAMRVSDKSYLMKLSPGLYVNSPDSWWFERIAQVNNGDESATKCGLGRFLNDSTPYNVYFDKKPEEKCAYAVAMRDIKSGEELFVSYGKMYWQAAKAMGVEKRNRPVGTVVSSNAQK